jgi:uncharacterized protein (TIGR02996 family)
VARHRPALPTSSADTEKAALFAGVKAEPDEDAPRLVLADWLEEHGDEDGRAHAELIRVQCEIVRRCAVLIDPTRPGPIHALLRDVGYYHHDNYNLPPLFSSITETDEQVVALRAREKELLQPWTAEGRIPLVSSSRRVRWGRGFASLDLEDVPFRPRDMAALAAGPFGPRIEQLVLHVLPSNVAKIARNEILAHLGGIKVGCEKLTAAVLTALLASPHLAGLRRLDADWLTSPDQVDALTAAPQRGCLTHLYLSRHPLKTPGFGRLAAADFPSLKALHFGGLSNLRAEGARALSTAPFLAHLRDLVLNHGSLGPEGMEALAAGPHFRCPARLHVGLNSIGPEGLRAILDAPGLEGVAVLGLSNNHLDDGAVAQLAASPRLSGLLALSFINNPKIGPAGAEALAASPHLARLASLDLRLCPVGEAGANALLRSPYLRRLQLHLNKPGLSEKTLAALRERFFLGE